MIYLDHAATTPVDLMVLEKMLPYFAENYFNPSASYRLAQKNRAAIDLARGQISKIINCNPAEIYFTSGGTESNNWARFGIAEAYIKKGKHIITTAIEHESVLKSVEALELRGFTVTKLPVNEFGHISLKDLELAITPQTTLVTIMYANNEIGTIENIAAISKICHQKGTIFHTDACQAAGALPLNTKDLNIDLMTLNSSKIYGPKGAGCLYIKEKINIVPLLYGGGQEHRIRAGTENVPAIVGFAEALKLAETMRADEAPRLTALRNELIKSLLKIPGTKLNGDPLNRLPNNVNISFDQVDGESLLLRLDMEEICASAGSSCTSGSFEPSHVITAINSPSSKNTKNSLRLTLGRENTSTQLQTAVATIEKIVADLRRKK